MNEFRVFLTVSVFVLSCYLVMDLVIFGFDWILLLFALGGFVCCHYLWPKKWREESAWYDAIEFIVDFPFRLLALMIRGIRRAFADGDANFDL